jgi:hypothetical protein
MFWPGTDQNMERPSGQRSGFGLQHTDFAGGCQRFRSFRGGSLAPENDWIWPRRTAVRQAGHSVEGRIFDRPGIQLLTGRGAVGTRRRRRGDNKQQQNPYSPRSVLKHGLIPGSRLVIETV